MKRVGLLVLFGYTAATSGVAADEKECAAAQPQSSPSVIGPPPSTNPTGPTAQPPPPAGPIDPSKLGPPPPTNPIGPTGPTQSGPAKK